MSNFVTAVVTPDTGIDFLPAIGEQTQQLLAHIPADARASVQEVSLRVLSRCGSSADTWSAAQLVVGEVQSGKTMSFTTVMALARDNEYPLIVVLAGTKKNLLAQTEKRLKRDLGMTGDGGLNPWRTWTNPTAADASSLHRLLGEWSDTTVPPHARQTAVIFVLKHTGRLDSVAGLLNEVFEGRSTPPVRTLVIDDEADQASLNIKAAKGEESSVYAAVQGLRSSLAHHVYLMYTATPQAPLLISIADALSPEKVTILTAGKDYVGGGDLFADPASEFVRKITDLELLSALDPDADEAPPSLQDALAFWTLALVIAQERLSPRPLTMLVHPASARDLHKKYDDWVSAILNDWRTTLADKGDVAYDELVQSVFVPAYDDLRRTVTTLPPLDAEPGRLTTMLDTARLYLNRVEQRVVNSETAAEIPEEEWKTYPGWIVIGGNKLDRGFTVQDLAVTYMPRGRGVGNADTIQQRGRFFGYKRKYLDLLRGWFSDDLARIFKGYVEHERSMRAQLREVDEKGASLKEWRRKLLLDPDLRPTRQQVMTLSLNAAIVGKTNFPFRQEDLYVDSLAVENHEMVGDLRHILDQHGVPEAEDRRPQARRHKSSYWDYVQAMRLLEAWVCSPAEREQLDRLLFVIAAVQDQVDVHAGGVPLPVKVVGMDSLAARKRSRSATASSSISRLFQGRASTQGYPGDDAFRDPAAVTIQLHMIEAEGVNGSVPALAVGIPDDWERRVHWELPR